MDLLALVTALLNGDKVFSDIHLRTGLPPMVRGVAGLERLGEEAVVEADLSGFLDGLTAWRQVLESSSRKDESEADLAMEIADQRFRANYFTFSGGTGKGVVLRRVEAAIRSAAELGLPASVLNFIDRKSGLVLVCGHAGSGKSTTLASFVRHISTSRPDHIITIEDPIEFVHASATGLVTQREVGTDSGGFSAALRAAMREDPNVIMVGEIRDRETAAACLAAAESGQLVLGPLHACAADKAVERLADFFPSDEKPMQRNIIASNLVGVIAQVLLPDVKRRGRVLAYEIMANTPAVTNHIREDHLHMLANVLTTSAADNMVALNDTLRDLVKRGRVTHEDARRAAYDTKGFELTANVRAAYASSAVAGARS